MGKFITKQKAFELMDQFPGDDKSRFLKELQKDYEIEGINAEFSVGESAYNIPKSAYEFGSAVWSAITDPAQTVESISKVGNGALLSAFDLVGLKDVLPEGLTDALGSSDFFKKVLNKDDFTRAIQEKIQSGEVADQEQLDKFSQEFLNSNVVNGINDSETLFDSAVDFFIDRYGSKDKALNTLEKDPVGFLSDAASIVGGAGLAAKLPKISKIGSVATIGDKATKLSRLLEPTTAAGNLARKVFEGTGINSMVREASRRFILKAGRVTETVEQNIGKATKLDSGQRAIDFIIKHGMADTLPNMAKNLDRVRKKTSQVVDDLLDSIPNKFSGNDLRSVDNLLSEMKKVYVKNVDDIAENILPDGTVTKDRTQIGVPKENLPQSMLDDLDQIKKWEMLSKTDGLTLKQINEIKRTSDRILSVYDRSGEPKGVFNAQKIAGNRSDVRNFIEQKAKDAGIPDVKELNKQTQEAMLWRDEFHAKSLSTEHRAAIMDQMIVILGISGSAVGGLSGALTGGAALAPIAVAGGIAGARALFRTPKVRAFMSNWLRLLTDKEYQPLLRSVETGIPDKEAFKVVRKLRRDLQKTFPELRLTVAALDNQEEIKETQKKAMQGVTK